MLCLDVLSPSCPHQQAAPVNCQPLSLSFFPSLSLHLTPLPPLCLPPLSPAKTFLSLPTLLPPSLLPSALFRFPRSSSAFLAPPFSLSPQSPHLASHLTPTTFSASPARTHMYLRCVVCQSFLSQQEMFDPALHYSHQNFLTSNFQ